MFMQRWLVFTALLFTVCAAQAQSSPTGDGGLTIKDGQTISFDAQGKVIGGASGFWKGLPSELYTVGFSRQGSIAKIVLVQFQGTIHWNQRGEITSTSPDFAPKNTKTSKTGDKWAPVKSFKIEKNAIIIVTSNAEKLRLYDFEPTFVGKVDPIVQ